MENLPFGITLLVLGMGGTMATLALIAGIIHALTLLFPCRGEAPGEDDR